MDKTSDLGRFYSSLLQHDSDTLKNCGFRRFNSSRDLAGEVFFTGVEHHVGKSAADIGREADRSNALG
jgi:hypothetical protein